MAAAVRRSPHGAAVRHECDAARRPAHGRRRARRSCSANRSRANDHLTGVPGARGAAAFDGDADDVVDHLVRFPRRGSAVNVQLDGTADSDRRSPSRSARSPRSPQSGSATRPDRSTSTCRRRRGAPTRPPPPRSICATRRSRSSESTKDHPRPAVRRDRRAARGDLRDHLRRSPLPPTVDTGRRVTSPSAADLLSIDGQPVGLSFTAHRRADPARIGRSTPPCCGVGSTSAPAPHVLAMPRPRHGVGFDVDQVVLAQPDDGHGAPV